MRHRISGRKLGTDASHTKAMKKSLTLALLENDRIKTTQTRAKEIRGEVDRVITWAKRGDVHSRRLAIKKVGDKDIVRELFEKVEKGMFANRPGGYTRIYKLGNRKGDNAPMVIIELVTETCVPKEKKAAFEPTDSVVENVVAAPLEASEDVATEDDAVDAEVDTEVAEAEAPEAEAEETEEAPVAVAETPEAEASEATPEAEAEAPTEEAPAEEA